LCFLREGFFFPVVWRIFYLFSILQQHQLQEGGLKE
jgi:hypothetical protein